MGLYFLLANKSFPHCQTEFIQQFLIFLQQISYKSVLKEGLIASGWWTAGFSRGDAAFPPNPWEYSWYPCVRKKLYKIYKENIFYKIYKKISKICKSFIHEIYLVYKVLRTGSTLITFDYTLGIKNNLNNFSNILIPVCSAMEFQGYTKPIYHTPVHVCSWLLQANTVRI